RAVPEGPAPAGPFLLRGQRRGPSRYAVAPHTHQTGHRMPALASSLDPRSQDFQDNVAFHRALVDELDGRLARAADGGGDKAREKHVARGKLPARERIAALLDPGSPFLEIAPLAAEEMYD